MPVKSINANFERERGKSGGYPASMRYTVREHPGGTFELCIEDQGEGDSICKLADSWGFAAFDMAYKTLTGPISLRFAMRHPSKKEKPKNEALKRRLSYLAAINDIHIILTVGGEEERLYTLDELAFRPETEVIRDNFVDRSDADTPGRLEKDFQAYLFGKGLYEGGNGTIRTNERLALFGSDFVGISNKGLPVEREFPTGVFSKEIKESARILPTEYVDLVTFNKFNEVAIIELKFDDSPLEVIAQLLNYALFFHSYKTQLTPLLNRRFACDCGAFRTKAYLVSNVFHKRFEAVWPYYSCGPIAMRQVVMGYMLEP